MFYIGGVLRGFDRFAEKAPVEGYFFKTKVLEKSPARVFFLCVDLRDF